MAIKVVSCDNVNDRWEDPRSCALGMSCDTSDRQVLGTRIFKFTVAGVVKDGRVGCGGVLYAASGIIRGMFSGLKIWSDLNLAALFTIKSELKLFSVTMWAGGMNLLVELESLAVLNWLENPCS
ncbi:hypothetical protein V6N12_011176 [Hibiscus sabdariffa]|uniref:RNase H type-1 domain-containing protein n=1 Tax=Hibiscus sabdariffa TaxID=183260 RepID=A0ABR2EMM7_9ROSI